MVSKEESFMETAISLISEGALSQKIKEHLNISDDNNEASLLSNRLFRLNRKNWIVKQESASEIQQDDDLFEQVFERLKSNSHRLIDYAQMKSIIERKDFTSGSKQSEGGPNANAKWNILSAVFGISSESNKLIEFELFGEKKPDFKPNGKFESPTFQPLSYFYAHLIQVEKCLLGWMIFCLSFSEVPYYVKSILADSFSDYWTKFKDYALNLKDRLEVKTFLKRIEINYLNITANDHILSIANKDLQHSECFFVLDMFGLREKIDYRNEALIIDEISKRIEKLLCHNLGSDRVKLFLLFESYYEPCSKCKHLLYVVRSVINYIIKEKYSGAISSFDIIYRYSAEMINVREKNDRNSKIQQQDKAKKEKRVSDEKVNTISSTTGKFDIKKESKLIQWFNTLEDTPLTGKFYQMNRKEKANLILSEDHYYISGLNKQTTISRNKGAPEKANDPIEIADIFA